MNSTVGSAVWYDLLLEAELPVCLSAAEPAWFQSLCGAGRSKSENLQAWLQAA